MDNEHELYVEGATDDFNEVSGSPSVRHLARDLLATLGGILLAAMTGYMVGYIIGIVRDKFNGAAPS